ncbi:unnamed protein product [Paramecium primaurelia]|uniref:Transmembrane protein n=1 Tax=Paramecium primaurelia TaxID=5886 RepID=A0A8S1QND0_PARPR|nr:unnamed protein product [Paramecium primaurelia]
MEMPNLNYARLQFTSSNRNDGQVSIRNVFVSTFKCYPSCKQCTGPKSNQFTTCYYRLPTKIFVHPVQLIMKNTLDAEIFVIQTPLYTNGFSQSYLNSFFANAIVQYQQPQWLFKYDLEPVDKYPTKITSDCYGIFNFNSGIYRFTTIYLLILIQFIHLSFRLQCKLLILFPLILECSF